MLQAIKKFYNFIKFNLPWLFLILSLVLTSLLTMLFYYLQNANQKSKISQYSYTGIERKAGRTDNFTG
jgi:hypothetical protein